METGTATIVIDRASSDVFDAIADVTRTGEWSPECNACRWVDGAIAPAIGVRFEGDNAAVVAGRTLKRWTTTSEITAYEPGKVFEFVAEGFTTWRYELEPVGQSTRVTETFQYVSKGFQGFVYGTLLRRPKSMTKGMQRTLDSLKRSLEST